MKDILKYIKNYKWESILAPLFKLLEACFELTVPLVVAAIIDKGINDGEITNRLTNFLFGWMTWNGTNYVLSMCAILVVLGLVGLISAVSAQFFAAKAAVGFSKELRNDLFDKIQSLSYYEIDHLGTSKMITRMTSDVNQVQSGVNLVLRLFMRSPFIVFGAMIMAYLIDLTAGNIFLVSIFILSIIVFTIMLISIPLYKKVQGNLDQVTLSTRETLTGVRVIRAFCKEEEEISQFKVRNNRLYNSQMFVGRISALMNPLTYVVINVAIIILIKFGAVKVNIGSLSQGQVVALYNYMSQILVELIKLANLIITVTKSFASADRIAEILRIQTVLSHKGEQVENSNGYIEFRNVGVKYYKNGANALSDVSFAVKRGQTVGIIGGTGSGKTTLVNLLAHFYDCSEGQIIIDGQDVKNIDDTFLREQIGIVPQKAVLFKGTIRENIQWGDSNASDEKIMQAIEVAQASDVIATKENGLDELVEQGGKNFSGGQRQRLTIARALVKHPNILILDDSASALDYATDAKLRQAIKKLDYNPTTFIVSQRTASIQQADIIIVLDCGKVVGIGTHDELLRSCDVYQEIYQSQFKNTREGA